MFRTFAIFGLLAGAVGQIASAADSVDALRAEMQQRNSALVQQGFNLTNGVTLGGARSKVLHFELLVPPADAEHETADAEHESSGTPHELSFWAHAVGGDVTFRVTAPDDHLLASWDGQSGETHLTLVLPVGRSRVDIDGSHADSVFGLLGVKGPVLRPCRLDPARVATHAANVSAGFYWSYLLYMPRAVHTPFLLAVPNNSGFATSDPELLAADGTCAAAGAADLAERLGTPVLVPLFPRPRVPGEDENLYLHALTRESLLTRVPGYARVDLQLAAMLDDATRALASQGIKVSRRVLLSGFSASGSFVSRFAMLHPDRVLAVASGSPGGWPIVPEARDGRSVLPYPVGTADLKSLIGAAPKVAALRHVAWFFFLGDSDTNDSILYRDSFSRADAELIFNHFGSTLPARWKEAARLYRDRGLNARFKLYPDVAHEVSPEMQADIAAFFVAATHATDH